MTSLPLILASAALAFQGGGGGPLVSKEGGFRVDMPAKAVERPQQMETPFGKIDGRSFAATRGKLSFYVSYSDYPPDVPDFAPDKVLDRSMNGAVNGVPNAVPLAKRDIRLGDAPGKEFEFAYPLPDGAEALCRARFYLLGRRLYSVMLRGPRGDVLAGRRAVPPLVRPLPRRGEGPGRAEADGAARPESEFTMKPGGSPASRPAIKVFTSEAGGFRVAMPGKPQERTVVARSGDGEGVIEAHFFAVVVDDVRRLVSYLDRPRPLPPEEVDAGLEEVVRGSILSGKGTLVSKRPIRLGATPGREFEFDSVGPDGRPPVRPGPRLPRRRRGSTRSSSPARRRRSPAPGDAFLDSFALTGPAARRGPGP